MIHDQSPSRQGRQERSVRWHLSFFAALLLLLVTRPCASELIKVGIFQNKPIVYFEQEPKGLFVEILDYVAEKEGWEIAYIPCELRDCLAFLRQNDLDLMTCLGESPQRLKHFVFSKEMIWTFWGTIYAIDKQINTILDLKGKRIGVRRKNKITAALKDLVTRFGLKMEFVYVDNYDAAFDALTQKRVDAVAVNNTTGFNRLRTDPLLHKTPIIFNPFPAYFAVPKQGGNPELLDRIDDHVRQLRNEPENLFHEFEQRWFGVPSVYWTPRKIGIGVMSALTLAAVIGLIFRYVSTLKINRILKQNIQERQRIEHELRISEQTARALLNATTDSAFLLDKNGCFVITNQINSDRFEMAPEQMIGLCVYDLIPTDLAESRRENIEQVFNTGTPARFTDHRSGLVFDNNIYPVIDKEGEITHVAVFARDITQTTKTEAILKESETKYKTLFENMVHGVFYQRKDGVLFDVNPAALKLFGLTRDQFLGRTSMHPEWKVVTEEGEALAPEQHPSMIALNTGQAVYDSLVGVYNPQSTEFTWVSINAIPEFKPKDQEPFQVFVTMHDMTAQRRAEQALRESREQYRIVADFTFDWEQWFGPQGELKYTSPSCERVTGYSKKEFMADPELFFSIIHPDDLDMVKAHFQQAHDQEILSATLDFRIISRDGATKWLCHYCNPVNAGDGSYLGRRSSNREITQRKQYEQHLQESEQRFRELFNNMWAGVAIYYTPDDGDHFYFKDLNQAGLKYGQKVLADVLDHEVREVFPGVESLGLFEIFRQVYYTGEPMRHPTSAYEDDEIKLWVENYICKLPSGELVAIFEDTTSQVKAEQAQRALQHQVQQAQKMESIGSLAGGIAHDFNNILFPIVGMSDLLLEDLEKGSPEYENAQQILTAGKRGSDLVRQILSFSRQDDHQVIPVRFQQVLKEVLKLCKSTIPSNISIQPDIHADCGMVMANPTQLHQIAMNLITNAYHAVEDVQGRIDLRLREVEFTNQGVQEVLLPAGRYVNLTVRDNGKGISQELIDRIFDPYFTTKEKGRGTGLGLSVVFGIVKEYKGDIRVTSDIGQGSAFDVYLPMLTHSEQPMFKQGTVTLPSGREHILLVDDEKSVVQLGQQVLQRLGYHVEGFTDSQNALMTFKEQPQRFDLVITDMTMPNLTGDRLAREMINVRPDIPIIICTGFSERINEDIARSLGVKGLLMKPVVRSEMAEMIRNVLDGAE